MASASALREGIRCDGGNVVGDSHICTATAGGATAVRYNTYRHSITKLCQVYNLHHRRSIDYLNDVSNQNIMDYGSPVEFTARK